MPSIPRPMIVSWAIDGVLALSLLSAVYQGGQFVERLDSVVTSMEALSSRVTTLETRPMGPEAARRISVLETLSASQDRALTEMKADLTNRLDRIEDKLDRALQ